jgi:hypothetical protein
MTLRCSLFGLSDRGGCIITSLCDNSNDSIGEREAGRVLPNGFSEMMERCLSVRKRIESANPPCFFVDS